MTNPAVRAPVEVAAGAGAPVRSAVWRLVIRVVPVVLFGFLTVVAILDIGRGNPSWAAMAGSSGYAALLVLQVTVFAIQPAPRARDGRAGAWVVTLVGSFAMVVAPSLPPVRMLWAVGPAQTDARLVLSLAGMALALPAMLSLRTSFSLTPQARRLATGGLYRVIRHPLYTGEILNIVGLTVALGSLTVLIATLVVVAGEVARATLEERLLRRTFPGYDAEFAGVAHLLPGVW